jgi:hypothetical protein
MAEKTSVEQGKVEQSGSVIDWSKSTRESMQETLETIEWICHRDDMQIAHKVNATLSMCIGERRFGERKPND